MSMVRCDECDHFIDSDDDPDCFGAFGKGEVTLCEWCREVALKREVVPINYDDVLSAVREAMDHEPSKTPLPQWVNTLYGEVENLLAIAAGPELRDLSKEEMLKHLGISYDDLSMMAQAGTRLQLIASNIDCRTPPKFKVVSR